MESFRILQAINCMYTALSGRAEPPLRIHVREMLAKHVEDQGGGGPQH